MLLLVKVELNATYVLFNPEKCQQTVSKSCYPGCRSWCGCCCQAWTHSGAGCPETPGRIPGSRDGTAPLRRGTTPPSCWSARRLLWGHGTATGSDGGAPPRCSLTWLESRCSSWGYTFLTQRRGKLSHHLLTPVLWFCQIWLQKIKFSATSVSGNMPIKVFPTCKN